MTEFRLFPHQASSYAADVDALYFFMLGVTVFFVGLICFLVMFFAVRYHHKVKANRLNPPESIWLEISWSIVPAVLAMTFFFWGAIVFLKTKQVPPDAATINVVGKQWMWKIQHPNGKREINELHLPLGQSVKLRMISEDVIHSFYIPDFRVKMDVLPGRYTEMWFQPTRIGSYHLFCAEYCGTSHSTMIGKVIVMDPAEYADWLQGGVQNQPADLSGKQLFEQFRCNTCHLPTGQSGRCPPLDQLYGTTRPLADGSQVLADDEYIRESILEPNAKIVAGAKPVMPTYRGQIGEEGILQIIAYLKSLKNNSNNPPEDIPTSKPTTSPDDAVNQEQPAPPPPPRTEEDTNN